MKPFPSDTHRLSRCLAFAGLLSLVLMTSLGAANALAGCPGSFTITASDKDGGTIDPQGEVIVPCGESRQFTITPDACYDIAAVIVDGNSVGAVSTYDFFSVIEDHTIHAEFVLETFTLVASAGVGGSIFPPGASLVDCDTARPYTITPDPEHVIADVLVDGVSVGDVSGYSFDFVQAPHTIRASFAPKISIGDAHVAEGDAGPSSLVFRVVAPATARLPFTAHYESAEGSATLADNDYAAAVGDVTVQPLAPTFDRKWGTGGTGPGQFQNPTAIAVDDDGFVYVADYGRNRIQKFDADGAFVSQWGSLGTADGQFNGPAGVAADHAGNIYVVDSNNGRVQKFTNSGGFLLKWGSSGSGLGQFSFPFGVAVDLDGAVYVADQLNHRVQKFSADGVPLLAWGSLGSGPGQFSTIADVAVDEKGHVYATDFGNRRVQRFDTSGAFQTAWTLPGVGTPVGIAVDGTDAVFVADGALHRILAYDATGTLIHTWGSFGTGDGQFSSPYGVAANHRAQIYTVEVAGARVQKFSPRPASAAINLTVNGDTRPEPNETLTVTLTNPVNGVFRKDTGTGVIVNDDVSAALADARVVEGNAATTPLEFSLRLSGPLSAPASVHYESEDGSATVADADYAAASGNLTIDPPPPAFALKWGSSGNGVSQFQFGTTSLTGIALDAAGNVYVADGTNDRVQKFDANGTFLAQWGSSGSVPGTFDVVTGIAVDPWGFVYVVDAGNQRIQKFEPNGDFVASLPLAVPGVTDPLGLAIDAAGFLYLVDGAGSVQKFDRDGNFVQTLAFPGSGLGEFQSPIGIAVDPAGFVYVSDATRKDIQKLDSNGAFVGVLGSPGSGDGQFQLPSGLAVDALGYVYAADEVRQDVQKLDSSGGFVAAWGFAGAGDGEFDHPQGVAADGAGNVFVLDRDLARVQKFAPATAGGTIVVNANGDPDLEPHEYLSVVLSSPVNLTLLRGRARGVLLNDESGLAVTEPTGFEGQSGTSLLSFGVSAQAITCDPLTLHYETLDGTAMIADNDYAAASGDLSLDRGAPDFQLAWGSIGATDSLFNEPLGVAVDDSGNVYVADRINHRIQKFTAAGVFVKKWGTLGSGNGDLNEPYGLAVDGRHLYVSDGGNNRVQKFTTAGAYVAQWGGPGSGQGQFNGPYGVAVDGNGDVYVADRFNHRIQKFDPNGIFLLGWGANFSGNGPGEFDNPIGVAADAAGHVFVADFGNDRVQEFDDSGTFVRAWGTSGASTQQFNGPFGIAIGDCGRVYVSDRGNHRIQEFDSTGVFRAAWGSNGSANEEFANPDGIGVAIDGTLYVADEANHRIQKFAPALPAGTIDVTVQGDTNLESDEAFTLELTSTGGTWTGTLDVLGTIQNDDFAPTAQILVPNGGQSWPVGSTQNVTWTASDDGSVSSVDLAYSTDGGTTFPHPIATGIANSGSFAWPVPNTPTTMARVRVTAHDDAGHSTSDDSDAHFSIVSSGPANLCGNPGFEFNLAGWIKYESATLSRVSGGYGGSLFALQVRGGDGDDFGCNDSPNWISQVVAKGAVYRFSARVRSDAAKGKVRLRVFELLGSSLKGSGSSSEITLGLGWQPLRVDYVVKTPGTTLSMRIIDDPKKSKEIFLVDDVSILLISAPADRAPVVTAPLTATAPAGLTRTFTVSANDPDGQTITSFLPTGVPAGASFTTNLAKTSGTFTWTPAEGQVSGVPYHVTFTATNALTGTASTDVTVTAAPPNLCSNGGFESGISGWGSYAGASLAWFTGGGHTGTKALQVATSSSSSFGCDDVPDAVSSTAGIGSVYRFSAWVRSVSHTGKVKIRVYEYIGGSQQGSTVYSQEIPLTAGWQPLVATHTVQENGSYLTMRITDASGNQTFLVDDVEVQQIGSPTLMAGPGDAHATTAPDEAVARLDAGDGGEVATTASPASGDVPAPTRGPRASRAEGSSLDPASAPWALRLEGLPQTMEAAIPAVFLKRGGREVAAIVERTLLGEDGDGNGIEELWAYFAPGDLAPLFQDLSPGTESVETTIEARSSASLTAAAPLTLALETPAWVFSAGVAPNPARLEGRLFFTTTRPGHARVHVYDAGGRRVRTLLDTATLPAGPHQLALGGGSGRTLASGLYFYRVETAEGTLGGRFVLIQ